MPTTLTSVARAGAGDDVVDVGHRGEVEHRAAAVELLGQVVEVEHVDLAPVDVVAVRRLRVEHPHGVAGVDQGVDDVRADEARATGDRPITVLMTVASTTEHLTGVRVARSRLDVRTPTRAWSRRVVITADTGRQM